MTCYRVKDDGSFMQYRQVVTYVALCLKKTTITYLVEY